MRAPQYKDESSGGLIKRQRKRLKDTGTHKPLYKLLLINCFAIINLIFTCHQKFDRDALVEDRSQKSLFSKFVAQE